MAFLLKNFWGPKNWIWRIRGKRTVGNKNEDTFVSDFLHRSEKKVRRQQKPFGVHRSLRNPFVAVFQEFRVCWQPKSHYIKSLHCFAESFFFPPPCLGVQTNVFRSLPLWNEELFHLGIRSLMDLAEVKSTALHLSWWVGRSQGKPQEKDGGCVATTWGPLVGKIFLDVSSTKTTHQPIRFFKKTGQLFFSENVWTPRILREGSPPGGFPKVYSPKKTLEGSPFVSKQQLQWPEVRFGGHLFFFHETPKKGYDYRRSLRYVRYVYSIPFFMNLRCKVYTRWLQTPMVVFLKWWYPTTMGFPTKNDHFGVFWGYHHLRKHPYI